MKITFFDKNPEVVQALAKAFEGEKDVTVLPPCDLRDVPRQDAIVTAGNCFATMTGGIDLAVRDMFGFALQDYLQDYILRANRPLYIGQALLVYMPDKPHGAVIYAPTIYTPQPITKGEVFLATFAAIGAAINNKLDSIACPGMGTLTGNLHPALAASAMRRAYTAANYLYGGAFND